MLDAWLNGALFGAAVGGWVMHLWMRYATTH